MSVRPNGKRARELFADLPPCRGELPGEAAMTGSITSNAALRTTHFTALIGIAELRDAAAWFTVAFPGFCGSIGILHLFNAGNPVR